MWEKLYSLYLKARVAEDNESISREELKSWVDFFLSRYDVSDMLDEDNEDRILFSIDDIRRKEIDLRKTKKTLRETLMKAKKSVLKSAIGNVIIVDNYVSTYKVNYYYEVKDKTHDSIISQPLIDDNNLSLEQVLTSFEKKDLEMVNLGDVYIYGTNSLDNNILVKAGEYN